MSSAFDDMLHQVEHDRSDLGVDPGLSQGWGRVGRHAEPSPPDEADRPQHDEPEHDEPEHDEPGEHGGTAGGTGEQAEQTETIVPDLDEVVAESLEEPQEGALEEALHDEPEPPAALEPEHDEQERARPVSLEKTDHQEAVQQAAMGTGTSTSDSSGSDDLLAPRGFTVAGSDPFVRNFPEPVLDRLREILVSAAVREHGADVDVMKQRVRKMSQGSLVMAFLLARLDLRMEVDVTTRQAADLFRSQDPLMGAVLGRLEALEQSGRQRDEHLARMGKDVRSSRRTGEVTEQLVSYFVADRQANFLKGHGDLRRAPITAPKAVQVRDKARELTAELAEDERRREGRPLR